METKLTLQEKTDIRVKHQLGISQSALAREYEVSRATIQNTLRGFYVRKDIKEKKSESFQENWERKAKDSYLAISRKYA